MRRAFRFDAGAVRHRLLPVIAALAAGLQASAEPLPAEWASRFGRDHPLAGRIWLAEEERFVASGDALARISRARFVLIGEKHDNPDHHRLQAWIVRHVAATRRPAIALEAIDQSKTAALDDFLARRPKDAQGLGAALGWEKSGWPDWRLYAPVVEPVLAQGGPVLATVPAPPTLAAVRRNGIAALSGAEVERLGLATDLPEEHRATLERAIAEGHCNRLPARMTGPMATVQRVKDAAMARALIAGAETPGRDAAVLIAGNGHVRKDHGVPWHLARLAPGQPAIAVALIEVQENAARADLYAPMFGVARLPFDIALFTPRADDADPCATHADQFRRLRGDDGKIRDP